MKYLLTLLLLTFYTYASEAFITPDRLIGNIVKIDELSKRSNESIKVIKNSVEELSRVV